MEEPVLSELGPGLQCQLCLGERAVGGVGGGSGAFPEHSLPHGAGWDASLAPAADLQIHSFNPGLQANSPCQALGWVLPHKDTPRTFSDLEGPPGSDREGMQAGSKGNRHDSMGTSAPVPPEMC